MTAVRPPWAVVDRPYSRRTTIWNDGFKTSFRFEETF
jgi:hypothetical protein